jgi:hypothetical protein
VSDHGGQTLAYIYFENGPGRRSAAKLLSKDERATDHSEYCEAAGAFRKSQGMKAAQMVGRPTMPDVKWMLKGREFAHCNCAYGCPCQFNAYPTHGDCHAILGYDIEQGYHGDTKLDGLKFAGIVSWPSAIHQGMDRFSRSSMREPRLHNVRRYLEL